MELPDKANWVPQCDQDGLYKPRQTRLNKEQFCVVPSTGEIAFDPFRAKAANETVATPVFCPCFVQQRIVQSGVHLVWYFLLWYSGILMRLIIMFESNKKNKVCMVYYFSGHVRNFEPQCDEKTGLYGPVQTMPNGMKQCYSLNGTTTSEQFFDDGINGPIPARCMQSSPAQKLKQDAPKVQNGTIKAVPATNTSRDSLLRAPARGKIDPASRYSWGLVLAFSESLSKSQSYERIPANVFQISSAIKLSDRWLLCVHR